MTASFWGKCFDCEVRVWVTKNTSGAYPKWIKEAYPFGPSHICQKNKEEERSVKDRIAAENARILLS